MKRLFVLPILLVGAQAYAASTELDAAIMKVRNACGGISSEMSDMKRMAGINTAVTGVGTAVGVGATAVGVAKSNIDERIAQILSETENDITPIEELSLSDTGKRNLTENLRSSQRNSGVYKNISEAEEKSKRLGNWRTGLLATNTATNVAGAVMSGKNKVEESLFDRINACISSVKELSRVKMQARISGESSTNQDMQAQRLIDACSDWETVDLSSIDNRAKGATISSGVGAGAGFVGTIVSAISNSSGTRSDNSEAGQKKEKNLNTAANVMAGSATVASGVATIFNATQINAIKRAADAADKCEGAL